MSTDVIFITGGQRSGKSVFAESKAKQLSDSPIYIATAMITDDEMAERVERHRARRGAEWRVIEAPLKLSIDGLDSETILFDSVTTFVANHLVNDSNVSAKQISADLESLINHSRARHIIFVSDEVGLGGISSNQLQRQFVDMLGDVNQAIASLSSEAWMIVSGMPLRLK